MTRPTDSAWMERALECVADHGGQVPPGSGKSKRAEEGARDGAAGAWRRAFLDGPYLRDALVLLGMVSETFETAITWDRFVEFHEGVRAATVSEFLVFDPDNPGAIVSAVGAARENARAARELISSELWEVINTFYLELRSRNLRADVEARPHELYDFVKRSCQTISGVAVETMPRDDGWRFLQLGWMLERAEMTCRLLDVRYSQLVTAGATGGFHHWLQTLKSASGSEAFRRRYRASMDPADVVEFLLLSRTFPRSVLFCLRAVENDLNRLEAGSATLARPQRVLGRTRSDLEFLDTHELLQGDLHVFLDQMLNGVRQVAEAVALQYFRGAQEHGRAFDRGHSFR